MQYLTKIIGKWMLADSEGRKNVAVDSKPRLSGIMDTINATRAHAAPTKLPKEFYDPKSLGIIDKIAVEEWYSGYLESREYRILGIGALMGDVVSRITGSVQQRGDDGLVEIGGEDGHLGRGRGGESSIKLALSGCHDTTLAGVLCSLGAFENEKWPPFTSHVAIELFRGKSHSTPNSSDAESIGSPGASKPKFPEGASGSRASWWNRIFGSTSEGTPERPKSIGRTQVDALTPEQRAELDDYYVRVRYNDKIMRIPGCKAAGKHWDGDASGSFCTLVGPPVVV